MNFENILSSVIAKTKSAGADEVDAVIFDSSDKSARVRQGKLETLESSKSVGLGIRALVKKTEGFSQSMCSTNDMSEDAIARLVEDVVSMAKAAPADPHLAMAEKNELCKSPRKDLEMFDDTELSTEKMIELASEVEEIALDNPNITNSEGGGCGTGSSRVALATSKGFFGEYKSSNYGLSVSVIASDDNGMETDYSYSSARFLEDLKSSEYIGLEAAKRAAQKLSPRKIKSCDVPVIFDKRIARSLIGNFIGAINGSSIARGTSFLKEKMGEEIFSSSINIIDNPHIKRASGTSPFDSEGIEGQKMSLIKDGILQSWLLDLRTANQLDLKTTGHASRGLSSSPSPSSNNVIVDAGDISFEDMLKSVGTGLYLTDTFGMGINSVTGDYSQGAAGIWIENGALAYPVSEITVAAHMSDMFKSLIVANDQTTEYSLNCPTLLIDKMTIAGA